MVRPRVRRQADHHTERLAVLVNRHDEPNPAAHRKLATAHDAAAAEEIRAITRRYVAPGDVEAYIARWPGLRTIVTIVAAHIVSWPDAG